MSNRYLVPVRIDCGTGNCTTGTGTYEKQTVDFSRKQNNWVVPVPGTRYVVLYPRVLCTRVSQSNRDYIIATTKICNFTARLLVACLE